MRIQNLTERLITLPPVEGFLDSERLVPGENDIPDGYLEALRKEPAQGRPDHRLYLEELLGCERVDRRGNTIKFPAQLRIPKASEKKINLEPETLDGKGPEVAAAYVNLCDDVKVLRKWRRADKRADVVTAIDARLAVLGKAAA